MGNTVKRLRVFAGPNGSGKSTLYDYLVKIRAFNSYFHINPDSIARDLPVSFSLSNWPVSFTETEIKHFLGKSSFQSLVSFVFSDLINVQGKAISLTDRSFNDSSYLAAALADFLRAKMLDSDSSFSFESVFSHPSKIDEIKVAKKAGYKTYLYFIATSDPRINLQRVRGRVESGGHDVPNAKILDRYIRTMENCYAAFRAADKVFFFDNSDNIVNNAYDFFAEKADGKLYVSKPDSMPEWFDKYILQKMKG
jgi:predicted ABC-type ATPase